MKVLEYDVILARRCRHMAAKLGAHSSSRAYLLKLARRLEAGRGDYPDADAYAGAKPEKIATAEAGIEARDDPHPEEPSSEETPSITR